MGHKKSNNIHLLIIPRLKSQLWGLFTGSSSSLWIEWIHFSFSTPSHCWVQLRLCNKRSTGLWGESSAKRFIYKALGEPLSSPSGFSVGFLRATRDVNVMWCLTVWGGKRWQCNFLPLFWRFTTPNHNNRAGFLSEISLKFPHLQGCKTLLCWGFLKHFVKMWESGMGWCSVTSAPEKSWAKPAQSVRNKWDLGSPSLAALQEPPSTPKSQGGPRWGILNVTTLIWTALIWCNNILCAKRKRKQDSFSSHLEELMENVITTEMNTLILDILIPPGKFQYPKFPEQL